MITWINEQKAESSFIKQTKEAKHNTAAETPTVGKVLVPFEEFLHMCKNKHACFVCIENLLIKVSKLLKITFILAQFFLPDK